MLRSSVFSVVLLALCGPALANPGTIGLPNPVLVGQATVGALGLVAYEGRLYTEGGAPFGWSVPVALELQYRRRFSAAQILKATETELRRVEGAVSDQPRLLERLAACFRDVGPGDSYVAVGARPDELRFVLNGREVCRASHPDIRRRFLSIWLSDKARFPSLSRKLRGL